MVDTLNRLRVLIQHSDYWQTGENLWEEKSGVEHHNAVDDLWQDLEDPTVELWRRAILKP